MAPPFLRNNAALFRELGPRVARLPHLCTSAS